MPSEKMEETALNGSEIVYIIAEAEAIKEWNSVRAWCKGEEVLINDLQIVFYNSDQEEEIEEEMKTYEFKVFHRSETVDKAWIETWGKTKEEALENFKEGNYEWLDSKQIDTVGGEFIDEEDWELVEVRKYKD